MYKQTLNNYVYKVGVGQEYSHEGWVWYAVDGSNVARTYSDPFECSATVSSSGDLNGDQSMADMTLALTIHSTDVHGLNGMDKEFYSQDYWINFPNFPDGQVCSASGTDYYLKASRMEVFMPTAASGSTACDNFDLSSGNSLSLPIYDPSVYTPSHASTTVPNSTTGSCFSLCNLITSNSNCNFLKQADGVTNAFSTCNTAA